jgi:hypothetical protein
MNRLLNALPLLIAFALLAYGGWCDLQDKVA